MPDSAFLYDPAKQTWLHFKDPVEIIRADNLEEVQPALQRLEQSIEQQGLFAAGFLSYEAAPAFDPSCQACPPDDFPLLQFGLFKTAEAIELPQPTGPRIEPDWAPALEQGAFTLAIDAIKNAIARGDTYQVNYTFPLRASLASDPWQLFLQMVSSQRTAHAGYLDCGRWAICSASPELFFDRQGRKLTMRPMKGTSPRGRTLSEDRRAKEDLRHSAKDRAENIMILDMVRNDLGRLAITGSVCTEALCEIEKYPTVWQLTSTASAESEKSLPEIFQALFPCASITGAPKPKTMQIINRLEGEPRRIYTGAFGWAAPGRRAHFSVAIRTALIDRQASLLEYGVGAGITWDSNAADEYQECLTKARLFSSPAEDFSLFETLRWTPGHGYFLREEHIQRLIDSAEYFDLPCLRHQAEAYLDKLSAKLPNALCRVRLLLSKTGQLSSSWSRFQESSASAPVRLKLAAEPIDCSNPFLYHKTTRRQIYEQACDGRADVDDVLLWNTRGELTETTIANLVLDLGGQLATPPVCSGLLPGTYRSALLKRGCLQERVLTADDLQHCRRIFLINSLRKWRLARLVGG